VASAPVSVQKSIMAWMAASSAPFDRDLELAVIDQSGTHTLVFACRRILGGWIDAQTKRRLEVEPTHWREWKEALRQQGSSAVPDNGVATNG